MTQIERRRESSARLREYHEEIKALRVESDESYVSRWAAAATADTLWISRLNWIVMLERLAFEETERLMAAVTDEAAA